VHNGARFVAKAIEGVLAQTYRPLEVIVIDDGSTDSTKDALAEFSGRIVCEWQSNKGPAAARKRGVALARGDYFAFLDADDLWH
jgi:glycosyltransferase involved in cell wall biosynthesis